MPALVTPFAGESVDYETLDALVEWQIESGSAGIVPCGTTGESPTLSLDEHHDVVRRVVTQVAGRIPVIAGAGSNDTATGRAHIREAADAGADAVLVITPYYNRPDQAGIYAHFSAIAEASDLPVILYNVPGRTVSDVLPDTVTKLATIPNIVAIKDASGDVTRVTQAMASCPDDFTVLSGADELTLPMMLLGARGAISVTANVAPHLCADMMTACRDARWADARALHDRLYPLHMAMFASPSPAPVKYAMKRLGRLPADGVRLPMVDCDADARRAIDAALAHAGLA